MLDRPMRAILILLSLAIAGCTVGPNEAHVDPAMAPAYRHADAIDTRANDAGWWRGFGDPLLVMLVDRAVAGNTDLAQARARIDQSRAAARTAGAALLPTLDVNAATTAVSQSRDTPLGRISQAVGAPRGYTDDAIGTQASWEIDVFGGLRRGREAARDDLAAAQASGGAVAIAVAAETADAYLTLRAFQARLAIARDQERNQALLDNLVRQRVDQGVAADRERNRTTAQLEGVRATMAPLRAGIEAQLNRIDVLVGDQPGTNRAMLVDARPVPAAPLPAGSAAPADLLRRRPDIVAAERRLAASNARIGVAIADYYPHLSLSGLLGVASLGTAARSSPAARFRHRGAQASAGGCSTSAGSMPR